MGRNFPQQPPSPGWEVFYRRRRRAMDEMERQVVATGGCQCGAVRYALYTAPEGSVCHCRMCQKATGGLFAALAKVETADLVWTRGQPDAFRSSPAACRDFYAACGTPL